MRAQSREAAFKIIYCKIFIDEDIEVIKESVLRDEVDKIDLDFTNSIVNAFLEHRAEIENEIESITDGYSLNRIYKIDAALIFLAMAEIKFIKTPVPVVVNEVLHLAKKYSEEKSSAFINGVLAKIKV